MRAVTYVSNNTIEILEKAVPDIAPDGVLVRVSAAGLCYSDLAIINMGDENLLIGGRSATKRPGRSRRSATASPAAAKPVVPCQHAGPQATAQCDVRR